MGNGFPSPEDRWLIISSFIEEYGLVRQHIDSFNRFVEKDLKRIVKEFGTIATPRREYEVRIVDVELGTPSVIESDGSEHTVTPMECRIRDLTYWAPIKAKVVIVEGGIEREPEETVLGYLPIMLRSKADPLAKCFYEPYTNREECIEKLIEAGEDPRDPGGYFIINGSERVVVIQEDQALNRILVGRARAGTSALYTAKVISSHAGVRYQLILDMHKDGTLHVSMSRALSKIPFVIVMRALGLEKDRDIVLAVSSDPQIQQMLIPSLEQARAINTVEDALDFMGSRFREGIGKPREQRIRVAERIIDHILLPHIGVKPEDRIRKALFLGQMAARLLEYVTGRREEDDKDHYSNKRLLLAGDLIAMVFRIAMRSLAHDIRQQLEKLRVRGRRISASLIIRSDIITNRLREALATGNWPGQRTGVSQILDRTNWISTLSHLRRVVSQLSRSQPHFEARDVHGTQWGRICPFETPEGPNCGLVKNLALMAYVSPGVDDTEIEKLAYSLGVRDAVEVFEDTRRKGYPPEELQKWSKVFLNGRLLGYHPDGKKLAEELRSLRRQGKISPFVNVALYENKYVTEVYINTDAGRLLRPVFVVEEGKLRYTPEHAEKLRRGEWKFSDLLRNGIVEMLDADEEENAYIALNPDELTSEHTHMEIWPAAIMGVSASTIPYTEHNQSPRNTYQAAMAKQALGLYAANFQLRVDTRSHLLHYPEKPLVQTRALDVIGFNDRPAGQNMIVAVMSFTGYNIEDAIIMNKSSIERGLARSTFFRLYATEERRYPGGLSDRIEKPEIKVEGSKPPEMYAKLDVDGIISPEVEVKGGEVLVGKTSPPRFMEEYREFGTVSVRRRDTSVTMRHGERGFVDTVILTENIEGFKLVKVRVRDQRIPELGDKFASRHGQKGVIGMLIPQYDMPFTEDGVTPDLIINPHAFPSRMTLGQLFETIAGKAAAIKARFIDATPFSKEDLSNIRIELLKQGYAPDGTELLYDGRTGELLRNPILIGIVYYQKLHHMVADKMHARARGPVQVLTRQPTEGRAREGGLRFGEMERDCLVGHGAAMLLKERMLESSDKYVLHVCELCGSIAWFDRNKRRYVCPIHGDRGKIATTVVPYAFKLLLQELMSMCIMPRIQLGEKHEWKPGQPSP
ncbi:MAG: DNA-directed RNA polymerase subunit B [Hyperthermus sp.]|nr:MAG: DNA-directed RNA polymerase subunit B [Hyperthermus sp.]